MSAPVRVLSDGDDGDEAASGSGGGGQSVDESAGSAQVGSLGVSAPVRVLSDGDDGRRGRLGSGGGGQSVDDSAGSAQVGSLAVSTPIRVLSDSDSPGEDGQDGDDGVEGDVEDTVDGIVDEILGGASDAGDDQTAESPAAGGSGPADDDDALVEDSAPEPEPALEFVSGGTGDGTGRRTPGRARSRPSAWRQAPCRSPGSSPRPCSCSACGCSRAV